MVSSISPQCRSSHVSTLTYIYINQVDDLVKKILYALYFGGAPEVAKFRFVGGERRVGGLIGRYNYFISTIRAATAMFQHYFSGLTGGENPSSKTSIRTSPFPTDIDRLTGLPDCTQVLIGALIVGLLSETVRY